MGSWKLCPPRAGLRSSKLARHVVTEGFPPMPHSPSLGPAGGAPVRAPRTGLNVGADALTRVAGARSTRQGSGADPAGHPVRAGCRPRRAVLRRDSRISLDYSRNRLTNRTRDLLLGLARASQLDGWIERLFAGEPVNVTERRCPSHRAPPANAMAARRYWATSATSSPMRSS
jgi:hypothetical protein